MGTDLVSTVETNAEEIEDLKTNLNTTMTLALENQDTCEQVNEHSTLIQANTDNLEILNTKVIFSGRTTKDGFGFLIFDQVDINIGGGLDGSIGVFKAPIAGIYKMTFSGPFGYTFIVKNASTYFYMYESYTA